MRILFFGDGPWAVGALAKLLDEGRHVIGLVLRMEPTDPGLVEIADTAGLPVFQPQNVNEESFLATVAELKPDLNISVSYDQILRAPILQTAPKGFLNFHAGMLPNYRGRNILNWALINGEKEIGITAHYVDEGIDTGDIILQRKLAVDWQETYGSVLRRVIEEIPGLVAESVELVITDRVERKKQSHLVGTYFASRGVGDEWIDWNDTSYNIHNKIRAISEPAPGARTLLDDREIIIWRAYYDPEWPKYLATPGQVVGRLPGKGVIVKTADSTLLVQQTQTEGGDVTVPGWRIGTRFGINIPDCIHQLDMKIRKLASDKRLKDG